MTKMRSAPLVALLAAGLVSAGATPPRETFPHYSLRELAVEATTIVLAKPADDAFAGGSAPGSRRFTVDEVLRGAGVKVGESVEVDGQEIYAMPKPAVDETHELPTERALLFLAGEGPYTPVFSGMRLMRRDGTVLRPLQVENPGPYVLVPEEGAQWGSTVQKVKDDIPEVDRVLAFEKIEGMEERLRAIFAWIETHRNEFWTRGIHASDWKRRAEGWGSLETRVFHWIMDSCVPEDCWRAATLYDEITGGRGGPSDLRVPSFGSPEGRALLVSIATDARRSPSDRRRALTILGERGALWPYRDSARPRLKAMTPEEARKVLDALLPFLSDPREDLRYGGARAIFAAIYAAPELMESLKQDVALPALIDAYRNEAPGVVRDELAKSIHHFVDDERWERINGNKERTLVLQEHFGQGQGRAWFWLSGRLGLPVHASPVLVLERLDRAGTVLDRRESPLPVSDWTGSWENGWNGDLRLKVDFDTRELTSGMWLVTVKGTIGESRSIHWTSEPKQFQVP